MLTIHDLQVMRPSDAIEKASEMFPEVSFEWMSGFIKLPPFWARWWSWFQKRPVPLRGPACPAVLLAAATGQRTKLWHYWNNQLLFDAPEPLRQLTGKHRYDLAIASATVGLARQDITWREVADSLRARGL